MASDPVSTPTFVPVTLCLALNTCSVFLTPQDEANKLIASHGTTMIPEGPPFFSQSLSLTFTQSCNMGTTVLSVMTQELLSTTELSHRSELLSRSPHYSSTSSANRELPNTLEMTVEMMMLVSDTSSMAWKPPWFCYQICKDISQVRCFFC